MGKNVPERRQKLKRKQDVVTMPGSICHCVKMIWCIFGATQTSVSVLGTTYRLPEPPFSHL